MLIMKKTELVIITITLATQFFFSNGYDQKYSAHDCWNKCKNILCVTTNWAQHNNGIAKYLPKDVDASLCTHVLYSYANISDGKINFTEKNDDTLIKELMEKKKSYPDLKTLISVGGWMVGSKPFTKIVATKSSRKTFVVNAIEFLRKYDFEGLDLCWMYPTTRGSPSTDKQRFSYLIEELRSAFDNEVIPLGKSKLLLTVTLSASLYKVKLYEAATLDKNLDFINMMAYDFHGFWTGTTGSHGSIRKMKKVAEHWGSKASRNKIIIGMPFYGRTFTLENEGDNTYGARVTKPGLRGRYSDRSGVISYYEVCDMLRQPMTTKVVYEGEFPYFTIGDQWAGYDDEESLRRKVEYVREGNYGGVMVNDLSFDDFRGLFCGRGKYPLLKAINEACQA